MKAKTIEELREWINNHLSDNTFEYTQPDYVLGEVLKEIDRLEQKLIQPESIVSEPNDIDFIDEHHKSLSEPKQVTEDRLATEEELKFVKGLFEVMEGNYYNNMDEAEEILTYIKNNSPLTKSKQATEGMSEEITIFPEKEYHFQFRDLDTLKGISDYKVSGKRLMQYLHNAELSLQNKEQVKDKKIRQLMSKPSEITYEEVFNQENRDKVKDYILTESAKQTEEQKKHIIDFVNRLSEPKQVTEGIGFDDLGLDEIDNLILHWLNSRSENITQLSFDIVQYFKGLSLQNK